jgi:hypothetical protein
MRKLMLLVACCAWASVLQGCGPLQVPMASRPDDETQKSIDTAWNEALSPPNRFDHQGLLDLLLVARAYEAGVDRLTFRSEKQVVRGTVVMEVRYDRQAPDQDLFTVTLIAPGGQMVRRETYNRQEVELTAQQLGWVYNQLSAKKAQGNASAQELQQLAALEARMSVVAKAFPSSKEGDKAEGGLRRQPEKK